MLQEIQSLFETSENLQLKINKFKDAYNGTRILYALLLSSTYVLPNIIHPILMKRY